MTASADSRDVSGLFAEFHPRLRRIVARAVTTSQANVEDACMFAWVQLLRCAPEREDARGWLAVTAIREAIVLHRRDLRTNALPDVADDARGSDAGELRREARDALQQVARLPARQQRLLGLQVAGYSYTEIAALTGDSVRTVDRQLRRAHAGIQGRRRQRG